MYEKRNAELVGNYLLLHKGASNKDLIKLFGVSEPTFYAWIKRYPEFKAAIDWGRNNACMDVVKTYYETIMGGKKKIKKVYKHIKDATGKKQKHLVETIEEIMPPDAQELRKFLALKFPEEFTEKLVIEGKLNKTVVHFDSKKELIEKMAGEVDEEVLENTMQELLLEMESSIGGENYGEGTISEAEIVSDSETKES